LSALDEICVLNIERAKPILQLICIRHIRDPGRGRRSNVLRLRRKSLMGRRRILLRRRRVVLRVRLSVWARARWRIHLIIWLMR
jgi:hypothetical protein